MLTCNFIFHFSGEEVSPLLLRKSRTEEGFSFLPDVTVGLDATTDGMMMGDESVFESSRATRFASPDISPIRTTANAGKLFSLSLFVFYVISHVYKITLSRVAQLVGLVVRLK